MEIHTQIAKQDYIKYLRELCWQHNLSGKMLWCIGVVLFFEASAFASLTWVGLTLTPLIMGIIMFSILFSIPYALAVARLDDAGDDTCMGDYTITLGEKGLNVTAENVNLYIEKRAIVSLNATKNYIGIRYYTNQQQKRLLVLPKKDVLNLAQVIAYLNLSVRFAAP
jgi:hypothetical protein